MNLIKDMIAGERMLGRKEGWVLYVLFKSYVPFAVV